MVRALIEAGADVGKASDFGLTPVYIAAKEGYEAVVRLLIEAGADVNKAHNDGRTPLYQAAEEGHDAVARVLVEATRMFTRQGMTARRRCMSLPKGVTTQLFKHSQRWAPKRRRRRSPARSWVRRTSTKRSKKVSRRCTSR